MKAVNPEQEPTFHLPDWALIGGTALLLAGGAYVQHLWTTRGKGCPEPTPVTSPWVIADKLGGIDGGWDDMVEQDPTKKRLTTMTSAHQVTYDSQIKVGTQVILPVQNGSCPGVEP